MRNTLLLLAFTVVAAHASSITDGYCRSGTLDKLIALGDTGCFFPLDRERIYDISIELPEPADLSTFVLVFGGGGNAESNWQEATGHYFPVGAALSLKWSVPEDREVARIEWYQFDAGGNLSFNALPATNDGQMTMTAILANAYLGFQLELVPLPPPPFGAPEPSAFLPLMGIGLLLIGAKSGRASAKRLPEPMERRSLMHDLSGDIRLPF